MPKKIDELTKLTNAGLSTRNWKRIETRLASLHLLGFAFQDLGHALEDPLPITGRGLAE